MSGRDTDRRRIDLIQRFAFVAVGAVVVAAVLSTLNLGGSSSGVQQPGLPADPQSLRPSTHRLTAAPSDRAALVGFFDFDCLTCASLYPYVDKLSEMYEGRLTVAIRNFPEAGNRNAFGAALAVDAAAHQGRLRAMVWKLFEAQHEWVGEKGPRRGAFVAYARDLGLDMRKFKADLRDPRTRAKVEFDRKEALALGARASPMLYLDGEPYPVPETFVQMQEEIDAALEG